MQAGREYWGCSQRGRGRQLSVLPLTAQSTCRAYTEQFYQKQQHIAQRVATHVVINLQIVYRIVLLEIATYSSACCRSRRNQPADRNRIVLLEIATYRLAQRVAAHRVVNLQIVNRIVLLEIAIYSSVCCRSPRSQPAEHKQNSSIRNSSIKLSVLLLTAQSTCRSFTEQFYYKQQYTAQRVAAHLVVNLQSVYRTVLLEIAT